MARASKNKPEVKTKSEKEYCKILSRIISELKKVSWPSRKELINSTIATIVFIVAFAIVVGVVDLILGQLLKLIS